jgi:hypothetical protein
MVSENCSPMFLLYHLTENDSERDTIESQLFVKQFLVARNQVLPAPHSLASKCYPVLYHFVDAVVRRSCRNLEVSATKSLPPQRPPLLALLS